MISQGEMDVTEDLGTAINMVITGDFDTKLVATRQLRRWLSIDRSPTIQDVHFAKKTDMDMDAYGATLDVTCPKPSADCFGGDETLISHVCLSNVKKD